MPANSNKEKISFLLAAKLGGLTQRRVYQLAKELADRASIKTAEAIWVLAAQNGINLSHHLPQEVVDRVRYLITQIPAPARQYTERTRSKATVSTMPTPRSFVVAREFSGSDPILPSGTLTQAKDMATIYPLLYVLENSMREFLRRVIDARLGHTWWTTSAPTKIRGKIVSRMSDDEKNAWHQRRGSQPIDYLDLNELPLIVHNNHDLFVSSLIPSAQWFEQFVDDLYKSRCVVCHMNPLDAVNIQDVKLRLRKWQRHVKGKKSLLP